MSTENTKTKVSHKQILPYIEALAPLVTALKEGIEKMPVCSRKKSLLTTLNALEKKTLLIAKEISEEQATAYLNKHPELLQKLAHAARSDAGMLEIAKEVTEGEDVTTPEIHEPKKKNKRF